jgi:hypothetical protein
LNKLSQPPAAVETTSVWDEADWDLPGQDSAASSVDSILMPIYEEKDLDRWLASDTGSSAKERSRTKRESFTYPEPIPDYEASVHEGNFAPDELPFGASESEFSADGSLVNPEEEDRYGVGEEQMAALEPSPENSGVTCEVNTCGDIAEYPVPVIEEDPFPVSEGDFGSGSLIGQEQGGSENWEPLQSAEPENHAELPGEQTAGKVGEEGREATEIEGLSLSDQELEESGGLVLLEEPAESWQWYDYRACYGAEPTPAAEPALSAEPEMAQRTTEVGVIPQAAEPTSGDVLPEVYDPWCFYGYGLNEVLGFPTSVEESFSQGADSEDWTSEEDLAWWEEEMWDEEGSEEGVAEDVGLLEENDSEQSDNAEMIEAAEGWGQSAHSDWSSSPILDWDRPVPAYSESDFVPPEAAEVAVDQLAPGADRPDSETVRDDWSTVPDSPESNPEAVSPREDVSWEASPAWENQPANGLPSSAESQLPAGLEEHASGDFPGIPDKVSQPLSSKFYYHYGQYYEQLAASGQDVYGAEPESVLGKLEDDIVQESKDGDALLGLGESESSGQLHSEDAGEAYHYEYWQYSEKGYFSPEGGVEHGSEEIGGASDSEPVANDPSPQMEHTLYDLTEDDLYWHSEGVEEESAPKLAPMPPLPQYGAPLSEGVEAAAPEGTFPAPEKEVDNNDSPCVRPDPAEEPGWGELTYEAEVFWQEEGTDRHHEGCSIPEASELTAEPASEISSQDQTGETAGWQILDEEAACESVLSAPPVGEDQPAAPRNNDAAADLEGESAGCYPGSAHYSEVQAEEEIFWSESTWQIAALRQQYGRMAGYPVGPEEFSSDSRVSDNPGQQSAEHTMSFAREASAGVPQGLSLFAQNPLDLLAETDREVLEHLQVLQREGSVTIAATFLEEYLSTMGWHVFELANRAEEVLRTSRAMLARDPKVVVALLATCRLVERGELGVGEAARVLEQTLKQMAEEAAPVADLSRSVSTLGSTESWASAGAEVTSREPDTACPAEESLAGLGPEGQQAEPESSQSEQPRWEGSVELPALNDQTKEGQSGGGSTAPEVGEWFGRMLQRFVPYLRWTFPSWLTWWNFLDVPPWEVIWQAVKARWSEALLGIQSGLR